MPKVMKAAKLNKLLEIENFINEFTDDTTVPNSENTRAVNFDEEFNQEEVAQTETESESTVILQAAQREAEELLEKTRAHCIELEAEARNEGYDAGYSLGYKKGYEESQQENQQEFVKKCQDFFGDLQHVIRDAEAKKEEILENYCMELRDFAVAVAEKVIHVSLKSSGKIIENMILSATEKSKSKQWVKIYISNTDAALVLEGDADLTNSLKHISEHVKVEIINNNTEGTCIIEFPDQIIDASVDTQMENIKDMVKHGN